MSWNQSLCTSVDHSHKLVMMFEVMMVRTNHGVMHDIALRSPLRYVQGPCYNVHIVVAPSQSLDKALKACPVVSALQAQKTSAQNFVTVTALRAIAMQRQLQVLQGLLGLQIRWRGTNTGLLCVCKRTVYGNFSARASLSSSLSYTSLQCQ